MTTVVGAGEVAVNRRKESAMRQIIRNGGTRADNAFPGCAMNRHFPLTARKSGRTEGVREPAYGGRYGKARTPL